MKSVITGFVILIAVLAIMAMYRGAQPAPQPVHAAAAAAPRDLASLKRPAVRDACTKHPDWNMETCQTMDGGEVSIGMTADQVQLSWGKPKRVNASVSAQVDREQWVYGSQYLYMQNGVLRSMQTPR
jgi:hypothetical protein